MRRELEQIMRKLAMSEASDSLTGGQRQRPKLFGSAAVMSCATAAAERARHAFFGHEKK
jgi:hypothetical protein